MFVGICNPDALNIRIFNPKIALKTPFLFSCCSAIFPPKCKIVLFC